MGLRRRRLFLPSLLLVAVACGALQAAAAAGAPLLQPDCPADISRSATVPEGCPCNPASKAQYGACESGYVCAQPWALQVAAAAGRTRRLLSQRAGAADPEATLHADPALELAPEADSALPGGLPLTGGDGFVCQACSYGQLCRKGSVLPPILDPAVQMAIDALTCPGGFYCPTPAAAIPCEPGYFCPPGTIQPVTCNMTLLIDAVPLMAVRFNPPTVAQRVYLFGDALQGNSCPANASWPGNLCPEGSYCPTPSELYPCPAGFYCKKGSLQPQPCPSLASCPAGSASANLSFSGFIILAVLLVVLWGYYGLATAVMRMRQRRLGCQQEAQDRLWRALHPLLGGGAQARTQTFRAFRGVRPRLTLQFEGLGLELHDGRSILSGVSGRFEHSRLAAVMGPSGAGKSTFLSVLLGKAGAMGRARGRVLVNGREMQMEALRSITGFVPQEDIVHEDLSVRENLAYSARLRLSAAKPAREKAALVEDCLDLLQLRHVQHQVVGSVERRGISGGQRKRVNIGVELAAKPSLLFMDEPTSGLDSTAAADILSALTRMARLGMNIVCVVHQPRYSIFRMFDDVMLLGKGGRLVFTGPSRLALPYFESIGFALPPNENPADFAMDIISGSVPRPDGSAFQPADLYPLWMSHGQSWVQLHSKLPLKDGDEGQQADPQQQQQQQQRGVDPEQVQLLEEQFDAQDSDGDGALDAAGLMRLLKALGLEPSQGSVAALMAELAVPRTGLVAKQDFMQYVLLGGRPAPAAATAGGSGRAGTIPAKQRRTDSLYRVYSIEQYTLAGALSDFSAATLTPGLLQGSTSLRDLALAHQQQQQQQQQAGAAGREQLSGDSPSGSAAGSASGKRNAYGGRSSSDEDGLSRLSSTESPVTVHLPQPSPSSSDAASLPWHEGQRHEAQEPAGTSSSQPGPTIVAGVDSHQRQKALKALASASSSGSGSSTGGSGSKKRQPAQEQPMLVDVPQAPQPQGLLAWLGLSAGSPLRITPGTAAQFGMLLFRSGTKWTRNWSGKMLELLLLVVAGVVCGIMHGTNGDEWRVQGNACIVFLTLGILSGATSLSLFGFSARMVWWREQSSGIRPLSYFMAATCINLIDVALQPLVFLSVYYSMTLPALPFVQLYAVGLLVTWYSTSLGTLMSLLVPPGSSLMATVAILMITGGMLNGVSPAYRDMAPALRAIASVSYNRWAVEVATIQSFAKWPEWRWPATKVVMNNAGYCGLDALQLFPDDPAALADVDSQRLLDIRLYCKHSVAHGMLVLLALGCILRLLTALALAYCSRGIRLEPVLTAVTRLVRGRRRHRGGGAGTAATEEGGQLPGRLPAP